MTPAEIKRVRYLCCVVMALLDVAEAARLREGSLPDRAKTEGLGAEGVEPGGVSHAPRTE